MAGDCEEVNPTAALPNLSSAGRRERFRKVGSGQVGCSLLRDLAEKDGCVIFANHRQQVIGFDYSVGVVWIGFDDAESVYE